MVSPDEFRMPGPPEPAATASGRRVPRSDRFAPCEQRIGARSAAASGHRDKNQFVDCCRDRFLSQGSQVISVSVRELFAWHQPGQFLNGPWPPKLACKLWSPVPLAEAFLRKLRGTPPRPNQAIWVGKRKRVDLLGRDLR